MATAFALTSDTMDCCAGELIIVSPGCWAALTVTGLPFVEDKNRFALSASSLVNLVICSKMVSSLTWGIARYGLRSCRMLLFFSLKPW